jgi:hypothetical protein
MPRKKKSSSVKVNFKGVESRRTPPEGDYKCTVLEAIAGQSSNKNDQIEIVAEISAGEFKGQKVYLYCPLQENSLWKLHAFLTALGLDVPEDEMEIDLSELVDEDFLGVITHETYNGKKRAKLTDFDSLENWDGDEADDDDDEDEDDDTPKKGKKKSKKSDDSKKSKKSKGKSKKKSDDDDDDNDDEDEDDEPKKGKKSKSKGKSKDKPKKKSKKKKLYDRDDVEDMDEDELEELLEEAGLEDEVDLDDYKKLPKKVAAVIDALEEADLLEEDD